MNRINILGIKYCDMDIAEAVEHSVRCIEQRGGGYVLCAGFELALAARRSRRLMAAVGAGAYPARRQGRVHGLRHSRPAA